MEKMSKVTVLVLFLFIFPAAHAVTHIVGGNSSWTNNFDYASWATTQHFSINDTLQFNFGEPHSVDEVTAANYMNCDSTGPISSSSTSPTTITLDTSGTRYFICPIPGHCSGGQKLQVTVGAGSATPGAPPSPTRGSVPSTPGGSSSATGPPPPQQSAAIALGEGSGLVGGLISLVLVAMVGQLW